MQETETPRSSKQFKALCRILDKTTIFKTTVFKTKTASQNIKYRNLFPGVFLMLFALVVIFYSAITSVLLKYLLKTANLKSWLKARVRHQRQLGSAIVFTFSVKQMQGNQASSFRMWSKMVAPFLASLLIANLAVAQTCATADLLFISTAYENDFGTGPTISSDPNVPTGTDPYPHLFASDGSVSTGMYAIGRSTSFRVGFIQTEQNNHHDADGTTDGRYLGINPNLGVGEFYRIDNIDVSSSTLLRFSTALTGTCFGCADVPEFTLYLYDSATGTEVASFNSATIGVANDDIWRVASSLLDLNTLGTPVTSLDYSLVNSQPNGASGNDVGVDNIRLENVGCPLDIAITKTNTPGVNSEVDQVSDSVSSGSDITYTLVVTNNSSIDITGAVVTDVINSGLICLTNDTVTLTGNGVPAGSFTMGDLTGAGITLGTLTSGQSTTLTYTCEVQ